MASEIAASSMLLTTTSFSTPKSVSRKEERNWDSGIQSERGAGRADTYRIERRPEVQQILLRGSRWGGED